MKPKNLIIVRAVTEQGLTTAEAATRFGVTRQWVHTLLTRYQAEGLTGIARYKGSKGGFEKLLDTHGILQKNDRPGHPQTQGKIERFHQTLKRFLAAKPRPLTIAELQQLLTKFRDWYNTARPHRSLGSRTPEEAYLALPKASPAGNHASEWRSRTDKVDPHGSVTLRYAGKYSCSFTTAKSPSATCTQEKCSANTPSTQPRTTSPRNLHHHCQR